MEVVDKDKGGMFFVYGYGGTGKTYLYKTMSVALRSQGELVLNVASSAADSELILPVIPNGSRQDVVHATINDSSLWEHFTVMKLTVNMRLGSGTTECERKEIQDFADWILDIGNRNINGKNDGESTIEFPDKMLIPESDDHVDMINERMHSLIPGEEKIYESLNSVSVADADYTNFNLDLYTTDFLNTIRMSGKIISGGKVGTISAIPCMVITPSDNKMPFKLNRRQYPVQFWLMIRNYKLNDQEKVVVAQQEIVQDQEEVVMVQEEFVQEKVDLAQDEEELVEEEEE
ncbi:ATP-dependent DNA helicase PIF1-like protein [Tanacetum coccineum]|uniref:ATP-dependent DNA helicase n=1 Tax=Tanacetum coccineum TaxID=301880 RepID=A0ABQ5CAA6_9ASTR